MPQEISVDDFYSRAGQATPTPEAPAPSSAPREMPVDDFFSAARRTEATGKPATPLSSTAGQGRGKQGGAGFDEEGGFRRRQMALGVARAGADLADTFLSAPRGLMGSVAGGAAYAQSRLEGKSRRESDDVMTKVQGDVSKTAEAFADEFHLAHPFAEAVAKFTKPGDYVGPSAVTKAMNWLTEKIDKGGEIIDEKTGGVVTKAKVKFLADALMNYYGTKGLVHMGGKLMEKKKPTPGEPGKERFEAREDPTLEPLDPKEAQPGPTPAPGPDPTPAPPPEGVPPPPQEPLVPEVFRPRQPGETLADRLKARTQKSGGATSDATVKAMAGVGLGATGYALSQKYPDEAHKILGAAMGADMLLGHVRGIGDYSKILDRERDHPGLNESLALGHFLNEGENTLTVLDRLPQNRTRITFEQVEQELRRPDVPKPEKDLVQQALESLREFHPDSKDFAAVNLVATLNMFGEMFTLEPKLLSAYAGYGWDRIDRSQPTWGDFNLEVAQTEATRIEQRIQRAEENGDHTSANYYRRALEGLREDMERHRNDPPNPTDPQTVVWQAPIATARTSHFNEPNYFAHHREFQEGGKTHIIELQSDLTQRYSAPTEEKILENARLKNEHDDLVEKVADLTETIRAVPKHPNSLYGREVNAYLREHGYEINDIEQAVRKQKEGELVWYLEQGRWQKAYGEQHLREQEGKPMMWAPEPRPKNPDYVQPPYTWADNFPEWIEKNGKPVESLDAATDAMSSGDHVYVRGERGEWASAYARDQVEKAGLENTRVAAGKLLRGEFMPESQRMRLRQERDKLEDERDAVHKEREDLGIQGAEAAMPLAPMWKNWARRIIREVLARDARKGRESVRFADADAIAKVEGWPTSRASEQDMRQTEHMIREGQERIAAAEEFLRTGRVSDARDEWMLTALRREVQEQISNDRQGIEWMQQELETLSNPGKLIEGYVNGYLDEKFPDWSTPDPAKVADAKKRLTAAMQRAWDRGTYLTNPKHAGIYDRYATDIEKFLKGLGAKHVQDMHGHGWYEVPTQGKSAAGKRGQMFGNATVDQLKNLAAVTLGVAAGAYLDEENPIVGGVLGGLLGASTVKGSLTNARKAFDNLLKKDDRIRINNLTNDYAHSLAAAERAAYQIGAKIIELVPKRERREEIHRAIDEGRWQQLTGAERQAADLVRQFYADIAQKAQAAGVLDHALGDYSTHLWDKRSRTGFERLLEQLNPTAGMGTQSRFNRQRRFPTLAQGKAAGLTPLTEDVAEVAGIYGNSMARTLANKQLLERLKIAVGPGGERLLLPATVGHPGYVTINNPVLQAFRVHADIAPSLKFLYEAQEPGAAMAAISGLNTALKRNAVTFSLFHAKALADAALGAYRLSSAPFTVAKVVAQTAAPRIFGVNKYLKMVKEGGAGDLVDWALKSGVKISFERGESTVGDVGGGFYEGMKVVQNFMDEKLPAHLGSKTIGLYTRINHAFDNWMWGRLHAALKLEIFAAKAEALMENNAKAGTPISRAKAGEIAARYANDVFGGLDWRRLAENSRSRWGRDIALALNSPSGRRASQLLLFAPDWTLSTSRAFGKALVGKTSGPLGVKGLFRAATETDLYRQQLVRSALFYFTIGNALNYYFSGHSVFENKENIGWFYVDMGDGRKMQLSKHFTEPMHWLTDPRQEALNKLGVVPKEAAAQLLTKEYLSTKGMPPMDPSAKGRVKHAAKNALPIGINQMTDSAEAGISGSLGFPIYGKTKEQQRAAAKEKREKNFRESLERYKKAHGITQ